MYIEFLKAALHMTTDIGAGKWADKDKWAEVKRKFQEDAESVIKNGFGLFNEIEELAQEANPQSAWAEHLLRLALQYLSTGFGADSAKDIHISHRLQFATLQEKDSSDSTKYIIPEEEKLAARKRNAKSLELESTGSDPQTSDESDQSSMEISVLTFEVDLVCWVACKDAESFVLCTIVYRADNSNDIERKVQAEMCATNIFHMHRKPCIAVDIKGGPNWSEWTITATLISPQPKNYPNEEELMYEKSELIVGKGVDGLLALAAGLLEARLHFPNTDDISWNQVLGPVVSHDRLHAYKLFDQASYRQPNIKIIRAFLDENAILWKSSGTKKKTFQLVEMEYFESDWYFKVKIDVFVIVLRQLQKLHNAFGAHGDIRLGNLLSNGKIIDFDFMSDSEDKEVVYPAWLTDISRDGKRHMEVKEAIRNGESDRLKIEMKHDYFSMAAVMDLFQAQLSNDTWKEAIDAVRKGELHAATSLLEYISDTPVALNEDSSLALFGT